MEIIIFGTGSASHNIIKKIQPSVKIVAVSDNNNSLWGTVWNDLSVINPSEINEYQYDYILICSMYTKEIIESLIRRGIHREKIIPYFNNYYTRDDMDRDERLRRQIIRTNSNKKIALVTRSSSGCNCKALYRFLPNNVKEHFNVSLVELDNYWNNWGEYEIAFTTNIEGRRCKNRINVETWHGFPLKSLGAMEKNCTDNLQNLNNGIDHIISYSNIYSYIMSSVFNIDINKFSITGMPRNDFLKNSESRSLLTKLIKRDLQQKKIFFYMPTFRRRVDKTLRDGVDAFSHKDELALLNNYMKEKNSYLVIKKHPADGDSIKDSFYENIFFVTDEDLHQFDLDFYEILGGSDLLITDYSSVYFDYLLLDKPIIFWTNDLEVYEQNRGFLFDNISRMMPGPIVKNATEVIDAINTYEENNQWFADERRNIKSIVHHYDEGKSSERVWNHFMKIYFDTYEC